MRQPTTSLDEIASLDVPTIRPADVAKALGIDQYLRRQGGAMNEEIKTFGFTVRQVREGQNLTVEQLAEKAGMPAVWLMKIERGSTAVLLVEVMAIADALGVQVDELLRGAVAKNNSGMYRRAVDTLPKNEQKDGDGR